MCKLTKIQIIKKRRGRLVELLIALSLFTVTGLPLLVFLMNFLEQNTGFRHIKALFLLVMALYVALLVYALILNQLQALAICPRCGELFTGERIKGAKIFNTVTKTCLNCGLSLEDPN